MRKVVFSRGQTVVMSCDRLSRPFVIKEELGHWPCFRWTPASLAKEHPAKLRFRIGKRSAPSVQYEGQCLYVEVTLGEFVEWVDGSAHTHNPLIQYSPAQYWCYADYKYMKEMFEGQPHLLQAVDWSEFGLKNRTGSQSTFWLGSQGAYTVCHYDTYGWNLVAQITGRKRWILFPPDQSGSLYPTRIPYEESSVFSQVHVTDPDPQRHPAFQHTTPSVVVLEPGDVLYVPHHWWHYVECLETSISVNTWVDMSSDVKERLCEAITRTLVCGSLQDVTADWLNPTESNLDMSDNFHLLTTSLSAAVTHRGSFDPELDTFLETVSKDGFVTRECQVYTYRDYIDQCVCRGGQGVVLDIGTKGAPLDTGTKGAQSDTGTKGAPLDTGTKSAPLDMRSKATALDMGTKRAAESDEKERKKQRSKNSDVFTEHISGAEVCSGEVEHWAKLGSEVTTETMSRTKVTMETGHMSAEAACGDKFQVDNSVKRCEIDRISPGELTSLTYEDMVNCFVDKEVVELMCRKLKEKYSEKSTKRGTGTDWG